MIEELRGPFDMDMVMQEINRYADSEFRYSDRADDADVGRLLRDARLRERAAREMEELKKKGSGMREASLDAGAPRRGKGEGAPWGPQTDAPIAQVLRRGKMGGDYGSVRKGEVMTSSRSIPDGPLLCRFRLWEEISYDWMEQI